MTDEKVKCKITEARLSYPHVYKPRPAKTGKDPRYEAAFLLDPSNALHAKQILALKQEAARVAKDFFGDKQDVKRLKMPWGINDEEAKFCPGWFFVQAWSKDRPAVVRRDREPTNSEAENEAVFAGAYVNTNVTFFGWEFKDEGGMVKKGVSANLRALQYVKGDPKTDRFGGAREVDVEDEFEALGDTAAAGGASGKDPFDE